MLPKERSDRLLETVGAERIGIEHVLLFGIVAFARLCRISVQHESGQRESFLVVAQGLTSAAMLERSSCADVEC